MDGCATLGPTINLKHVPIISIKGGPTATCRKSTILLALKNYISCYLMSQTLQPNKEGLC